MDFARRLGRSVAGLAGVLALSCIALPAAAQEVTVLCNFEVDWCEALKAAYEKTTGQKAVFIRRTDGESLAQIRAEKANPRADIYHAAESASAKQLAAEGLLESYKSPRIAELHDWAQRIAEENKYFQTPIYTGVWDGATTPSSSRRKNCPSPSAGPIS
jgi:iron(III) transport system substrate-binding protein